MEPDKTSLKLLKEIRKSGGFVTYAEYNDYPADLRARIFFLRKTDWITESKNPNFQDGGYFLTPKADAFFQNRARNAILKYGSAAAATIAAVASATSLIYQIFIDKP
jgi:hypothetical protein